ncbi:MULTISPECIES: TatD family hydrolase [unclassified Carboxylicivirga]|uniref:TatD family hydrolase n=1 Tax=Carboxylicivirga TaxID=1628153 RepID=UPI003D342D79
MIDTHTHIYLPEFDVDRDDVIRRAKEAGVETLLLPNVDETTIAAMHELETCSAGYCQSMMGLHPTSVKANYEAVLQIIKKHLDTRPYVAVGEVGVDLYWDKTYRNEQTQAFEQQIIWAKQKNLPLVIHCRDAFDEVFEVVDKHADEHLRGVFHSFGGGDAEAQRIMDYGNFMLGINGVVTFKNTNLREVLAKVPMDYLVLETDAPYLAPVPKRGRRNEPSYLGKIAETIASVNNCSTEDVINQTTVNAQRLFAL